MHAITYSTGDGIGFDYLRLTTTESIIDVNIDIKPGSDPNSINLGDQGIVTVAVLGSADFDVNNIDPDTVEIGGVTLAERGSAKAPKLAYSIENVNGDGYDDFVAKFSVQELVTTSILDENTIELTLTAELYDGTPITGTDSVRIVPP